MASHAANPAITLKRAPEASSGTDGNFREVNKCLLRVMFDSDDGFCLPKLVALDETRKQTSRFPHEKRLPSRVLRIIHLACLQFTLI